MERTRYSRPEEEEEQEDTFDLDIFEGDEVLLNTADGTGLEVLEFLQRKGFTIVHSYPETGQVLLRVLAIQEKSGRSAQVEDLETTRFTTVVPVLIPAPRRPRPVTRIARKDNKKSNDGPPLPVWRWASKFSTIESDKKQLCLIGNDLREQDPYVRAVFRSAYSRQKDFMLFRLSLQSLLFGVANCVYHTNERGFFVYRVCVTAKPSSTCSQRCNLLSASPDELSFNSPFMQESNTTTNKAQAQLSGGGVTVTLGRSLEHALEHTVEKHGWKPAKMDRGSPPAVTWVWEIKRWGDGQVFDPQNPTSLHWARTLPPLPIEDPECVQFRDLTTDATWEVPQSPPTSSFNTSFGWTVAIEMHLASLKLGGVLKSVGVYRHRARKAKVGVAASDIYGDDSAWV